MASKLCKPSHMHVLSPVSLHFFTRVAADWNDLSNKIVTITFSSTFAEAITKQFYVLKLDYVDVVPTPYVIPPVCL